jgi:hypothetical protein
MLLRLEFSTMQFSAGEKYFREDRLWSISRICYMLNLFCLKPKSCCLIREIQL